MREYIKKLISKINLAVGGSSQTKETFHDCMTVASNVILHSIVKAIKKSSLDEVPIDIRLRIASNLTADINEVLMPIHSAIEGDGKKCHFDGTEIARELKAIPNDMQIEVASTTNDEGVQRIRTSVGKKIELDDFVLENEDLLREMILNDEIGKA
tara:strand:+ start:4442 stop:4906 length:465 start_codon:yes stop_codon:yes gene_type:complete